MTRSLLAVALLLSVLAGILPGTVAHEHDDDHDRCAESPYDLLRYYELSKKWCASYDGKSVGSLPPPCEEEKHDFNYQILSELVKYGPAFAALLW